MSAARNFAMVDLEALTPIRETLDQLAMLAVSGIGGAYFRAVIAPEQEWRKRVVQGIAGALSAIFLGGIVAHFVDAVANAGIYSYLASGFLLGTGGEAAVKKLQDKLIK